MSLYARLLNAFWKNWGDEMTRREELENRYANDIATVEEMLELFALMNFPEEEINFRIGLETGEIDRNDPLVIEN